MGLLVRIQRWWRRRKYDDTMYRYGAVDMACPNCGHMVPVFTVEGSQTACQECEAVIIYEDGGAHVEFAHERRSIHVLTYHTNKPYYGVSLWRTRYASVDENVPGVAFVGDGWRGQPEDTLPDALIAAISHEQLHLTLQIHVGKDVSRALDRLTREAPEGVPIASHYDYVGLPRSMV